MKKPETDLSVAVLVVSCDDYSDLWKSFFWAFNRFWPDCPFPVYLLSNERGLSFPGVINVRVGSDVSWSDNLRRALSTLTEDYVLLFLDDLLLRADVNTSEVTTLTSWMRRNNGSCLRFSPAPRPDKKLNHLVGIVSKGTIYRASTVLTLWRRDVLFDLLRPGESAWMFEVSGSVRADRYDGFYSVWRPAFSVSNAVIKGKWRRSAVKYVRSEGLEVDLRRRAQMSFWESLRWWYGRLRSLMLSMVTPKYRRAVKHWVLRGRYNYEAAAGNSGRRMTG